MKDKNKDIKKALLGFGVIAMYLLGSTIFLFIIKLIGINYNSLSVNSKVIMSAAYEVILTLLILYIYRKDFIPNLKQFIKNFKGYFSDYFRYWIFAVFLMLVSSLIIQPFTTSTTSANQEAVNSLLSYVPIYALFTTILIAPVLEESVFRLSFRKIFSHTNWIYILFSGLIFGAMHVVGNVRTLSDLLFIIPYSMPGFVLAYAYVDSDNICVPMGLHLLQNFFSVMVQMFL